MFDPYKTTYGKLVNINTTVDHLKRYINTVNLDELEYEYPSTGKARVIYITGYNPEEKELPVFDHPIYIKTLKGVDVLVTDLRRYVNTGDQLAGKLSDITRDSNSVGFCVTRALLTMEFRLGNVGAHRIIYKPAASAMGVWISGMVSTIVGLDPGEAFDVETVVTIYANTLFYPEDELVRAKENIAGRVLSSKHVYALDRKRVAALLAGYDYEVTNGMEGLLKNITKVLPESKSRYITVDSLIGAMGNVWYGPGGTETPIIALEDMPTWITILFSVITNRSYSKSRIGMLLNKHKRVIDSKAIDKHISNFITDIRIS